MKYLIIDPSGSFKEGKGQSGWVILKDDQIESFGQLRAKDYNTREEYWKAHADLCDKDGFDQVVIEEFRLYSTKAKAQINSEMETSKLIGYLEMHLWGTKKKLTTQLAVQAKRRFNDKILEKKGYITKDSSGRSFINGVNVSGHIVDALRHGMFFLLKERKRKQ